MADTIPPKRHKQYIPPNQRAAIARGHRIGWVRRWWSKRPRISLRMPRALLNLARTPITMLFLRRANDDVAKNAELAWQEFRASIAALKTAMESSRKSFGDPRRAAVCSRRHRRIARENVLHAVKLVSLELLTGGTCAGQPAVHQRQQVSSKATLIRMAHEDLLRILGVDGNLTPAAVVTWATERAIETNLLAAAVSVERDAALGRRLNERGVRLKLIDVHITGPSQGVWGERKTMVRCFPTDDKSFDSVGQR